MSLETVEWRPGGPRRSLQEVLTDPGLGKYIVGWGRPGDAGVIPPPGAVTAKGKATVPSS
jgi:hypothetical protein